MPDNKSKITGVIVVEGAKMNCSLGNLSQVPLTVNHKEDDKYFINQKKIATWREESIQHMNFGTCKRSNPQPACTPDISWKDYYENAEFGKQKILIDQSRGTCKYKGTVTIAQHGQKSQPSSQLYKKNNKNSYEIFMLSPQVAATQGKQPPSVSKIDLVVLPSKVIPANREVAFEIGGALKKITLVATVGKKDDKSLVSWAVYRGDDQKNRIKTYLEHGSTLNLNLEELPEGKTTIFGYGKTPSGDSTKIIINRKHNQLEGIGVSLSGVPMEIAGTAPKKTPVLFTPQYSFPLPAKKGFHINWKRKTKWTIADDKGTILYSSALGPLSSYPQGLVAISTAEETLVAMFINSGSYQVTLEDFTFSSVTQVSVKKTQSVTIKNRTAGAILNKSGDSLKIRKDGRIHLEASGIKFDYGFEGLGQKAYWHVQKDSGKIINLGLRKDVNMTVSQLIEEFKKQQVLVSSPYGLYKFQIDGEEKNLISIGSTSDTAVVEVGKNRMESIEGPEKIPVGAQVTYKIKALMSLAAGESVAWAQPLAPFIQFSLSADRKEARLQLSQQGKAHLSASLEGAEVSSQPIQKTVEASYVFLKKALWCYSNGKRRAETGWEESCFIHVSLEGLTRTPVKLRVWVAHPEAGKEASIAKDACLLKEMEATLNDKGSCQVPFIADKEIKEKIQKVLPEENKQVSLFFTLEFTAGELLDLSDIPLIHQENKQEVPTVATQGKIQHLVLDPDEDLKLPAVPRIKAINFSNEAADDIQVGVTQYGKKHKIWIHTVGMPKQKLVVIVYKQLLKEDLKETYNHKEKAFAATAQVKKYEAQEVGADGLLTLDFTPEKKDADGDPQLFYVAVFKEQKNEKDETVLMELGSQLKSLDSLPFDQELNKDASQVGIVMPTLEEGQTPTAEQLKAIVSKFFHFYNPLYVSETGTIEDQQVISPVLVERGGSKKMGECPRCKADFTVALLKQVYFGVKDNKLLKELAQALNKYKDIFKLDTCARKAHFFAQSLQEASTNLLPGLRGENFNYTVSGLSGAGLKAFEKVEGGSEIAAKHARKNRNDPPVSEASQIVLANWAYGNHYLTGKNFKNTGANDGWNFRGRGLFQITGRSTYKAVQELIETYAKNSGINIYKKYDSPNAPISIDKGWMTAEEAALTGMIDWFHDGMYLKADETGKLSDDEVVNSIIKIINAKTSSYPERRTWYKGGTVKDKKGKLILEVKEEACMKSIFRVEECGKVEQPLEFENEDGVLAKMKRIVDKHYTYKQETNKYRTEVSEKGLEFMDCSELVSRYLYELGVGINTKKNEPIYMTTANMTNEKAFRKILGNENIDLVGIEESFKPQRGDIFAWGYPTSEGWNGHTGIVYKYDEKKDLVTILEAIGKSGSADESNNKSSNGGYTGFKVTRTAVYKRTSKALVNHKGWFGYYRPKNYTKKL